MLPHMTVLEKYIKAVLSVLFKANMKRFVLYVTPLSMILLTYDLKIYVISQQVCDISLLFL